MASLKRGNAYFSCFRSGGVRTKFLHWPYSFVLETEMNKIVMWTFLTPQKCSAGILQVYFLADATNQPTNSFQRSPPCPNERPHHTLNMY